MLHLAVYVTCYTPHMSLCYFDIGVSFSATVSAVIRTVVFLHLHSSFRLTVMGFIVLYMQYYCTNYNNNHAHYRIFTNYHCCGLKKK